jgi:hypothetical protein
MSARYEIQYFDYANGHRSWHVYDTIESYNIHTANLACESKEAPECCVKICAALNAISNESIVSQFVAHDNDIMKQCPFCNRQSKRIDFSIVRCMLLPSGESIRIMCGCGAMSPAARSVDGAFEAWNHRM